MQINYGHGSQNTNAQSRIKENGSKIYVGNNMTKAIIEIFPYFFDDFSVLQTKREAQPVGPPRPYLAHSNQYGMEYQGIADVDI